MIAGTPGPPGVPGLVSKTSNAFEISNRLTAKYS